MYKRLGMLMGKPRLFIDDPKLKLKESAHHPDDYQAVYNLIAEWAQNLNRKELVQLLSNTGIICFPILPAEDSLKDAQFSARGMFAEVEDPILGTVKVLNTPYRFSDVEAGANGPLPRLGEHTKEILTHLLGYSVKRLLV